MRTDNQVRRELASMLDIRDPEDGPVDTAFIAGAEHAMRWFLKQAMSPSEFVAACDRIDRVMH